MNLIPYLSGDLERRMILSDFKKQYIVQKTKKNDKLNFNLFLVITLLLIILIYILKS